MVSLRTPEGEVERPMRGVTAAQVTRPCRGGRSGACEAEPGRKSAVPAYLRVIYYRRHVPTPGCPPRRAPDFLLNFQVAAVQERTSASKP